MKWTPKPYQRRAVEHLLSHASAGLFLDMGLGKTSIVLSALRELWHGCMFSRALIVAPKRVARETWPAEIKKWDHLRDLEYSLVLGSQAQRIAGAYDDAPVHIINYENLTWLVGHYGRRWPYDLVVFDESSKMKAQNTSRFKRFRHVRMPPKTIDGKRWGPLRTPVVACWLLSGTPAANGLLGLWAQAYCMDGGDRLGPYFTGFRDRYFESDYSGFKYTPRDGAADEINELLADAVMSMSAEDYLDMPERINNTISVTMPPAAQAVYNDMWRDYVVYMNGTNVIAANAAVRVGKCLQAANGFLYTDEDGTWTETHTEKLIALEEVMEEAAGQPVLVAYHYKADLERIQLAFPDAETMDAPNAVDRWNAGEIGMLLAHPASAGHGLNLQDGGHIIAWFGLPHSLELYMQFNARLDRQGQRYPVIVHHITARGTQDNNVVNALVAKRSVQDAFLDAHKAQL